MRVLHGTEHLMVLVNCISKNWQIPRSIAFADRAILLDENLLLFEQNNEKTTRKSIKVTVVGVTRVMNYKDIVYAQRQRDIKEAAAEAARGRRRSNRKLPSQVLGKRSRGEKLELAEREIRTLGVAKYCSVLKF